MACFFPQPLRLAAFASLLPLAAGVLSLGCYVGLDGDSSPSEGASFSAGEGTEATGDDSDDSDDSDSGDSEGTTGGEGESASGAISATEGDDSDSGDEPTGGDSTTSTTGDDPTTSDSGDPTTTGDDSTTSTTGDDSTTSTTGDDPTTSGGSTSTSGGMMGEYCDDQNDWMASWAALEAEVVEIVNQRRSEGANCGTKGDFGAAGPLTMHPLLQCAARLHSKDMVVRNFFSHDNPDGESPWVRIAKTGYGGYSTAGENIAGGSPTAAGVVQQWMDSDGHCANIMNPAFNEIGVGYYPGGQYGHYWTQKFTKK